MKTWSGNEDELKNSPNPSGTNLSDVDGNEAQFLEACKAIQMRAVEKVQDWLDNRCDEDVLGVEGVENFDEKVIARFKRCRPGRFKTLNTYFNVPSLSPENTGQPDKTPTKITSSKLPSSNMGKLASGREQGRGRGRGKPAVESRNHVVVELEEHPSSMGQDTEQIFEEVVIDSYEQFCDPEVLEENEMISEARAGEEIQSADGLLPISNHLPSVIGSSNDPRQSTINTGAVPNMEPNQNFAGSDERGMSIISDEVQVNVSVTEINSDLEPRNEMTQESVALQNLKKSIAAFWAAVPDNYK